VRYHIIHRTLYSYRRDVSVSHHLARLTPRCLPNQQVESHELRTNPPPAACTRREDYFGNPTTFLTFEAAHRELDITADSWVEITSAPAIQPGESAPWETLRDQCRRGADRATAAVSEFVYGSPAAPCAAEFAAFAAPCFPADRPLLEAALALNHLIFCEFKFDPRATTVATPLDQVMKLKRGVCQDFAHLQVACLRSLGIPARYLSGYLETKPPPDGPKLVGCDASHAWTQVWCGGDFWVGLDPTNDTVQTSRYIIAAWGRDFTDVSPIRGVILGGGEHELSVSVDVLPQAEREAPEISIPAGEATDR
jgi:transglutaminase-like putative cysteine protease